MRGKCPYCGGPCDDPPQLHMTERGERIYRAVLQSGPYGIKTADLVVHMFGADVAPPPSARGMLRVGIHAINVTLKEYNQRIRGSRAGRYRLISTKGK